jgi:DUF971 family protein
MFPPSALRPAQLRKIGQERFRISWQDGHVTEYTFRMLRQNCPCAECVSESTGERILDQESVPADLKGIRSELVGNYAVQFTFSDNHQTGIYTFRLLRALCDCEKCRAGRD